MCVYLNSLDPGTVLACVLYPLFAFIHGVGIIPSNISHEDHHDVSDLFCSGTPCYVSHFVFSIPSLRRNEYLPSNSESLYLCETTISTPIHMLIKPLCALEI